ncbi:hypothetical protein [Nitrospira lenta]|uniref:Uncharacterized protein n=1 Tax=Nitrospira lenta TaxID=1436998 RepID=A0A330LBN2_9BACT|nr:hypothetical protein [Nitrospira lenta]SPP66738.1 hypothetical protein NITLEN_80166 [Nitrospira lenta]
MAKAKQTPTGRAQGGPKALTGLEGPIIEGMATLFEKFGPAVGSAMYKAYLGNTDLFIQIASSHREGDYYVVELTLRNVSEHGVYLEALSLPDSPKVPLEIGHKVRKDTGMTIDQVLVWEAVDQSTFLPAHLRPGGDDSKTVWLRIGPISKQPDKLADVKSMKLGYRYSPLDEATSTDKTIRVRLR